MPCACPERLAVTTCKTRIRLAELEAEVSVLRNRLACLQAGKAELRASLGGTLDLLPMGIVLLDGEGIIAKANDFAQGLIATSNGLTAKHGRIAATAPAAQALLRETIKMAAENREHARPVALILPRSSGKPLSAVVAPIPRNAPVDPSTAPIAEAVLFVTDPARPFNAPAELLRGLFQLTPAEARVAEHLVAGCTIEETAAACGIAIDTARTHLKRIFEKVAVASQTALVRLVLNTPAWIGSCG